jgi:hypothetical protein
MYVSAQTPPVISANLLFTPREASMPIKLKPVLMLSAGLMVSAVPASLTTTVYFRPVATDTTELAASASKALPLPPDTVSVRGLYGYRYHGF